MKALLLAATLVAVALFVVMQFGAGPQLELRATAPAIPEKAALTEAPLHAPTPKIAGATPKRSAAKEDVPDLLVEDESAPPPKRKSVHVGAKEAEEMRRALADPKVRERRHAAERRQAASMRRDLKDALSLSEAEHNRLLDVLADQAVARSEELSAYMAENGGAIDANRMNIIQERQQRELASIFGPDMAKAFQAYEEAIDARAFVGQFVAPNLKDDLALSQQQTAHLVTALHETNRQFEQELKDQYEGLNVTSGWMSMGATYMTSPSLGRSAAEQVGGQLDDYEQRVLRAGSSVLSPQQLEVFGGVVREQLRDLKADFLSREFNVEQ